MIGMVNQKKQEILSRKDMESALTSGSEILVEVNVRPIRKLKENVLAQAFLNFSKEFHSMKRRLLEHTYDQLLEDGCDLTEEEYHEKIRDRINLSLASFLQKIVRTKINVPQYIYDGLEYFADEAYSEILTKNDLHDYYTEGVISF